MNVPVGCIGSFRCNNIKKNMQLCFVSGASPLWDDCKRLAEKGTDDARPHSRVLCRVQDTGWVSLSGAGFQ